MRNAVKPPSTYEFPRRRRRAQATRLRVLDAVLSLTDLARKVQRRPSAALGESREPAALQAATAPIEARLAGVVVAALKEAFDRDHQRIQLEREQREAERQRAERLLRLELVRQAGDRELAQLRLIAAIAVVSWLATVLFAGVASDPGVVPRVLLGVGWLLLLAALTTAFTAQSAVAAALARATERDGHPSLPSGGGAGLAAPWLLIGGLAVIALGVLLR